MKTICITGLGGYLGLATAYQLVEAGYQVIGLGSNPITPVNLPAGVVYKAININDTDTLAQFLSDNQVEVVYHFAAIKYIGVCEANPEQCRLINVAGTRSVLEAMVQANVPHIIYASTYAVYDWQGTHLNLTEESATIPATVYGRTKLESEALIIDYAKAGLIEFYQILRYANIVGAIPELTTHTPQSFLDKIVGASHSGEVIKINGDNYDTVDGSVARDFIDIYDVTQVHKLLVESPPSGIFNVSSESATTLKQLIELAETMAGKKVSVEVNQVPPTEPATIVVNSQLLRQAIAWTNKRTIRDTVELLSSRLAP